MGLEHPWILMSMASLRTNIPFPHTHIQILRDEYSPQSLRGMVIPILVYNTQNLFLLRISFWYVSFNAMVKIGILITFRLINFFLPPNFLLQLGQFFFTLCLLSRKKRNCN